ncbi:MULTISPECIES: spore cortex-lytic enzyme [Anaerotruncus]|uniref:Spore cortex-lytic enzyme n=2 Tax=Anaerotruncus TaxID=244127 RepID=A0A498CWW9_9FIRM|nr:MULTISPECIES: spore cortex-lytic enzyme [Anaerotruncus]MBC3939954.1 spore cortex-lytic enzyme [Anaerotruncus massiliensis (ex Togo et al. 2019)]MCQ4897466.1 spore cortex-lytic enzyme [Anaerotruncus sp. DFI.9.16]RLL06955.1 spore cortex-lytic enzyme [Anaerotruncus massiliensis (ex Liu et al. 2021)]GKH48794.1 spore cortex-lytic enzyme [Oscillospiraceae bacterium]
MSKEHGADARPVLLIRTISFSFALLLLIALGVFAARMWQTTDVLSKQGSRGNEVRQIQQKLKNWGYYFGEVDGIFGVQTKKAVMDFQRKNGLAVDGIAGNATLRAMGIYSSQQTSGSGGYSDSDIALLANIISAEARGEPFEGQVAVGAVVLNRVEHPSFPDTLPGVVYQPGAFTAITDGQINVAVAESARKAAREALAGSDPSGGALYYYNPDKTSNKWIRTRPVIKRIGAHLFCS